MGKRAVVLCMIAFVMLSCDSGNSVLEGNISAGTLPENLKAIGNDRYICFLSEGKLVASYARGQGQSIADYAGQNAILVKSKDAEYRFISLAGDVLVLREYVASGPSRARIVDLQARKDVLGKGFFSAAEGDSANDGDVIYRLIGDRLNGKQQLQLGIPEEKLESIALDAYKSGLALEFYEKYRFDFVLRKPVKTGEIVYILVKRTTWM